MGTFTRRRIGTRAQAFAVAVAAGIALASAAPAHASDRVLHLPVERGRIVALAHVPAQNWLAGHRGVDVASAVGAEVLSPGDGTISFAGQVGGRNVVTVVHPSGMRSSVEPVDASVARGDAVHAGDVLGTVQDVTGHCAPSVCVHWGVRMGDRYLNPLDLLAGYGPVTLLPEE